MSDRVAIIGGGHNGLVAAALLARSGREVVLLEARRELGGLASTRELIPGHRVDVGSNDLGMFRRSLIEELELLSLRPGADRGAGGGRCPGSRGLRRRRALA